MAINEQSNIHIPSMRKEIDMIKKVYLQDGRPFIVGYSGGKDSTLTLELVIQALKELGEQKQVNKITYVMSSDTMIENPTVKVCLDLFEKFSITDEANQLLIEFKRILPKIEESFWVSVIGRGYPLPMNRFRWCTRNLKIRPMNEVMNEIISLHNGQVINVMGIRHSESPIRAGKMAQNAIDGHEYLFTNKENNMSTIFAPVANTGIIELWKYLISISQTSWGVDTTKLYEDYSMSSGKCPTTLEVTEDEMLEKCGNSRWGCWMCPLSDKIWIDNMIDEDLKLLAKERKLIMQERDKPINRTFKTYRYSKHKGQFSEGRPRLRKLLDKYKVGNKIILPKKGGRVEITFNIKDAIEIENKKSAILDGGMEYETIYKIKDEYYIKSPASYTYEYRAKLLKRLTNLQSKISWVDVISNSEIDECKKMLRKFKEVI